MPIAFTANSDPRKRPLELAKICNWIHDDFEAHIKLARVHIDIGDMVSESTAAAHEKRIESTG